MAPLTLAQTRFQTFLIQENSQLKHQRQQILQDLINILRQEGTPEEKLYQLAQLINQQPELTLPTYREEQGQPVGHYLPASKKEII